MSKRIIEGTLVARNIGVLTNYDRNRLSIGNAQEVLGMLHYGNENSGAADWPKVGIARIELTLIDDAEIAQNAIDSLRAKRTEVQAQAQAAVTEIDRQIAQLLAIEHVTAEASQS